MPRISGGRSNENIGELAAVPTRERVRLLGATGTTGRLTLRHLLALGIPTAVAGRAFHPDDLLDAIGLTAVVTADPG